MAFVATREDCRPVLTQMTTCPWINLSLQQLDPLSAWDTRLARCRHCCRWVFLWWLMAFKAGGTAAGPWLLGGQPHPPFIEQPRPHHYCNWPFRRHHTLLQTMLFATLRKYPRVYFHLYTYIHK